MKKNIEYILAILAVAIFSLLLFGCDPVKRMEKMKAKICPLCFDSSAAQTITYRDTVLIHDTILEFIDSYAEDTVFNNSMCGLPC